MGGTGPTRTGACRSRACLAPWDLFRCLAGTCPEILQCCSFLIVPKPNPHLKTLRSQVVWETEPPSDRQLGSSRACSMPPAGLGRGRAGWAPVLKAWLLPGGAVMSPKTGGGSSRVVGLTGVCAGEVEELPVSCPEAADVAQEASVGGSCGCWLWQDSFPAAAPTQFSLLRVSFQHHLTLLVSTWLSSLACCSLSSLSYRDPRCLLAP